MSRPTLQTIVLALPALLLACGNGAVKRAAPAKPSAALSMPSLGTARSFSVLAGQTVTNLGSSTLSGDLGVNPGTSITGFPPGLVLAPGSTHAGDAFAGQAETDVGSAYDVLANEACTSDLSGQNLGERTILPGVYCFSSEALLSGTLVLDAKWEANAIFVFQITSKLVTSSGASVRLINGANPCNIFWQVGSSATLAAGTSFTGSILALTSITLETGASLDGRALARNGAVTLDSNQIRTNLCEVAQAGASCCFGAVACDGTCANLQTDANHCGACGTSCAADQVCSAGACTACPASRTQCSDQCADLNSDPFNCGACGKVCAGSQACVAGACGACDGTVCSNACVELSRDHENCGACGNACAADQCCNAGTCSKTGPAGSCKQP